MRHWPYSVIKNSPLVPAQFAWELYLFPQTSQLSNGAAEAVATVAQDTQPHETALQVIFSEGDTGPQLCYCARPSAREFALLEQIGVAVHEEGYFLFRSTTQ